MERGRDRGKGKSRCRDGDRGKNRGSEGKGVLEMGRRWNRSKKKTGRRERSTSRIMGKARQGEGGGV